MAVDYFAVDARLARRAWSEGGTVDCISGEEYLFANAEWERCSLEIYVNPSLY